MKVKGGAAVDPDSGMYAQGIYTPFHSTPFPQTLPTPPLYTVSMPSIMKMEVKGGAAVDPDSG